MAPLEFPGGPVTPQVKTPETLMASAKHWMELAAEELLTAHEAAARGDKATAIQTLAAAEHKSSMARSDIAEAIRLETASS